jgi:peptidoglycan/LPS O-acetylase OafA/YrhL
MLEWIIGGVVLVVLFFLLFLLTDRNPLEAGMAFVIILILLALIGPAINRARQRNAPQQITAPVTQPSSEN